MLSKPVHYSHGCCSVADLGGLGGLWPPLSCHLREYKGLYVLIYKHSKTHKFLHLVSFLHFTKYNNLYLLKGCTHHTPYFRYTPYRLAPFKNPINFV